MKTYYRYTDRHGLRPIYVSDYDKKPLYYHDTPKEAVKAAMNQYAMQEVRASAKLSKACNQLRELRKITEK